VKNDEGKVYIPKDPNLPNPPAEIDEIGFLEPGRGYFLGFKNDENPNAGMTGFDWSEYPGWPTNSFPGTPSKGEQASTIASAAHFQYKAFTHFFYPIFIDTVISENITPEFGDEIGVFDGDLCVGSGSYTGEFPIAIAAWKDDIATPEVIDGYEAGNSMTFIWYDASENTQSELIMPAFISAVGEDDPVAPTHSGFGYGFYAMRSFTVGAANMVQLPTKFKLKQNYPNPFNSETTIVFDLPERSKVRIELFNIQGQKVGLIYDGFKDAGNVKLEYNVGNLATGVYLYHIKAEGQERGGKFSDVGKMLLLK